MGKYTVGQQVRVRSDLVVGRDYRNNHDVMGTHFNRLMEQFIGEIVTIRKDNGYSYYIEGSPFNFTDEMLEPIEPEKPVEPLMPSAVLPIESIAKMEIYIEKVIVNDPATILFYRVANYDQDGRFLQWGNDLRKMVAKCNKDIGDKFDVGKGVGAATLKAYRKEIDKLLRKI